MQETLTPLRWCQVGALLSIGTSTNGTLKLSALPGDIFSSALRSRNATEEQLKVLFTLSGHPARILLGFRRHQRIGVMELPQIASTPKSPDVPTVTALSIAPNVTRP